MATNSKKMLINAAQKEELRVAIVEGDRLVDLDIEQRGKEKKKASIYKGVVKRVEPSLEAAFVDFGADRHGFLPIKEVNREYFCQKDFQGRPQIKNVLKPGQELIIQIEKEQRGTKGAALTTFIGLAGCYLVLMPNNPRAGGISRRIEGEEREDLKSSLQRLDIPDNMGVIIRTAGVGRCYEELKWDLDVLLSQWRAIQEVAETRKAPFLIHQEADVISRAMRDYLRPDIEEILVDSPEVFEQVKNHITQVRPDFVNKIKFYQESVPLISAFHVEEQIESIYQRTIQLKNGSSIVIDSTEALVAIDINSAKATKGGDIEETALETNLAAAEEIARQLRLRDIGGLIVIDFIDMNVTRNQRQVEEKLRDELKIDKARIQTGRISNFGLFEMSRQRLRPSLGESIHITCPQCSGEGHIRSVPSFAMNMIRIIEDSAMKENISVLSVILPVEVSTFILNENRKTIANLEENYDIKIHIIPNPHFQTPQYEIRRTTQQTNTESVSSYKLASKIQDEVVDNIPSIDTATETQDVPALKPQIAGPAPVKQKDTAGIIKRLWSAVFGASEDKTDSQNKDKKRSRNYKSRQRNNRNRDNQRQRHNKRGRNNRNDRRDRRNDSDRRHESKDNRSDNRSDNYKRNDRHGRNDNRQYGHDQKSKPEAVKENVQTYSNEQTKQHKAKHETVATTSDTSPKVVATAQKVVDTTAATPKVATSHNIPKVEPSSAPSPVVEKQPDTSKQDAARAKKNNATSFVSLSAEQSQKSKVTLDNISRAKNVAPTSMTEIKTSGSIKVTQAELPRSKLFGSTPKTAPTKQTATSSSEDDKS